MPPVYNQPIAFSQASPSLQVGQNTTVYVSGGTGSGYYISHNSNSNILQASLSGNNLSLSGLNGGNVVIVVCSSSSSCGAVTVLVNGSYYNNPGQGNWTYCAGENQQCYFSGTQNVRYGANGSYYYRTLTNGSVCTNYVFGDPAFGQVKQCWYSSL